MGIDLFRRMRLPAYAALTVAIAACGEVSPPDQTGQPPVPTEFTAEQAPAERSPASLTLRPGTSMNSFFDCLEDREITLVSAHRGGSYRGRPENSLKTMDHVADSIPALMEVDVAASADNILFLMHDQTLERTTNGTGNVIDTLWSVIAGLFLEDRDGDLTRHTPPTLAETLEWAKGRTILQLDIKSSVDYDDVIAEVRRAEAEDRVIYVAYTLGQARVLHRKAPDAMISVTIESVDQLTEVLEAGIPPERILAWTGNETPNEDLFRELNKRDIEVIFGTLGGSESIDQLIETKGEDGYYRDLADLGIDVIATDRPLEVALALDIARTERALASCNAAGPVLTD